MAKLLKPILNSVGMDGNQFLRFGDIAHFYQLIVHFIKISGCCAGVSRMKKYPFLQDEVGFGR